jgi:hypothetical protein
MDASKLFQVSQRDEDGAFWQGVSLLKKLSCVRTKFAVMLRNYLQKKRIPWVKEPYCFDEFLSEITGSIWIHSVREKASPQFL